METLKAVLNARRKKYADELEIQRAKCNYDKCAELCFKDAELIQVLIDIMELEQCTQEAK